MPVIFTKPSAGGGGVFDHGALTGLLIDDHRQYILVDGSRGFTSTVSGVMPTQSYHLVTRGYADTLSGTGQTNIASNLGSGEGIFFQKVGADLQFKSLIGGDNIILSADDGTITISGASGGGTSDHSLLSNLDYASSGHTGFQPAGDYITGAEITTISGDIISQIPTDFYSQSEVDTISGSINTKLDTHKTSSDHDARYYRVHFEVITLSDTDISNKYMDILVAPRTDDSLTLTVYQGIDGALSIDYTISGSRIGWDAKAWQAILEEGDKIKVTCWY